MVISDYYRNLDDDKKKQFRERVIEETGISFPTFYYKIRKDNWRKSDIRVIESIINNMEHA